MGFQSLLQRIGGLGRVPALMIAAASLGLVAAPPARAGGNLHVLGVGGSIQAAVDLAGVGDVILVPAGGYGSFDITGANAAKNLTIVFDGGIGSATISGPTKPLIRVEGVPAGGHLTLRGLRVVRGITNQSALAVSGCTGPVWIEDCELLSQPPSPFQTFCSSLATATVTGSDAVHFRGCTIDGTPGFVPADCEEPACQGSPALFAQDSLVGVWDSTLTGASGLAGGDGQPALVSSWNTMALGTDVFLSKARLFGGHGGNGALCNGDCVPGGNGGPGLALHNAEAIAIGGLRKGGHGGAGIFGSTCPSGSFGPPFATSGTSNFVVLPGPARSMTAPAVVDEGAVATFTLQGLGGDQFAIGGGTPRTPILFASIFNGVLAIFFDGSLYASDVLGVGPVNVPATMPQVDGTTCDVEVLHLQGLFAQTSYNVGPPATVVVLDVDGQ